MKRPHIAIIGDTEFRHDRWTGAAAIATETATAWDSDVELHTIAANDATARLLRSALDAAGVTGLLNTRHVSDEGEPSILRADVRMGDPLPIATLFEQDVIIVASHDIRLRRFLADLPVHTRPDVRIIASIHFERSTIPDERIEDLLRFDTLVGCEDDFFRLNGLPEMASTVTVTHPLSPLQRRMHGHNLRAAISWDADGTCSIAERNGDILVFPGERLPSSIRSAGWAAFIGAVAVGIARRDRWSETGASATQAYARQPYT